jgi:CheY-like chemotaxis protein
VARRRVVVIDDSDFQCQFWRLFLEHRYGDRVQVETHSDPIRAVEELGPDVHLLLLDWEMPGMNGEEALAKAIEKGVNGKRVIVTSAHSADRLHEVFDSKGCLAVIEKGEREQQAAFQMILDSIMKRPE